MPKKRRYIPRKDDDFFNFQGNLVDKVVAHKAAWGIPDTAVAPLVARLVEYEPLYHKAQNKTTRNRSDVLAHRQTRTTYEKEIRTLARQYLFNSPLVSDTERVNLGLTVRDLKPSPSQPISDVPVVVLRPLGGGDIEVRVKPTKDKTMPSIHPDANLIEYRYVMVESGKALPDDADACPMGDSQTRAKFIIKCGTKNTAKRFYGFFRWLNSHRPRQEGPWSDAQPVVIA